PVDDIQEVRCLVNGIDDFTDLLYFRGERFPGFAPRGRLREDDSPFTLAPTAIVEGDDKVTGPGEGNRLGSQLLGDAAPTVAQDDRRQGPVLVALEGEQLRGDASAFAEDGGLAEDDVLWG